MADRSGPGSSEPGDLDPLVLDAVVRAHAGRAAGGLLVAISLPVAAAVGATTSVWSWTAAAAAVSLAVLAAHVLSRLAERVDRDLEAMVGEP